MLNSILFYLNSQVLSGFMWFYVGHHLLTEVSVPPQSHNTSIRVEAVFWSPNPYLHIYRPLQTSVLHIRTHTKT